MVAVEGEGGKFSGGRFPDCIIGRRCGGLEPVKRGIVSLRNGGLLLWGQVGL